MLQVTPQMKIFVAVEAVDFRQGIDGLVRLCQETLAQDPFAGGLFVFRNRRGTSLKALVDDGQGFWLCQKRLSVGHFGWWPAASGERAATLSAAQLQVLFSAGNPAAIASAPDWRPVGARS